MRKEFLRIENGIKKGLHSEQLQDIQIAAYEGEVALIVGYRMRELETLSRLLQGKDDFDYGTVFFQGKKVSTSGRMDFLRKQVVRLADNFELSEIHSIADNLFVLNGRRTGEEPFFVQDRKNQENLQRLLGQFELDMSAQQMVRDLNRLQRYQIRLLRLFWDDVKVVLLDQRLLRLTDKELHELYRLIGLLKRKGMTFLVLDYRLPAFREEVDSITAIRDGYTYLHCDLHHMQDWKIHAFEAALEVETRDAPFLPCPQEVPVILELRDIVTENLEHVSLRLRQGEIALVECQTHEVEQEFYSLLIGEQPPALGVIRIGDMQVRTAGREERIRQGVMGFDRTEYEDESFYNLTVFDNYALKKGLRIKDLWFKPRFRHHIKRELDMMFGRKIADEKLYSLNQAELQRLQFLSYQLAHPRVLVCLNPFSSVDMQTVHEAEASIQRIADLGIGVLVLSRSSGFGGAGGATPYELTKAARCGRKRDGARRSSRMNTGKMHCSSGASFFFCREQISGEKIERAACDAYRAGCTRKEKQFLQTDIKIVHQIKNE